MEMVWEACYLFYKRALYTNISNTMIIQSVYACIGNGLSLIPSPIMSGKKTPVQGLEYAPRIDLNERVEMNATQTAPAIETTLIKY